MGIFLGIPWNPYRGGAHQSSGGSLKGSGSNTSSKTTERCTHVLKTVFNKFMKPMDDIEFEDP